MRILFAHRAYDNTAGGVEKMSTILMNELCARGHDIAVMTFDAPDAKNFFPFDSRIAWHKISLGNVYTKATLKTRLKRALAMRAVARSFKPDLILGFQDGMFMAARLYTIGMSIPVVAAERNAPSRFNYIQLGRYRHFVFQMMRLAKAITVQCESFRNDYPPYLRSKIVTIPNPVKPAASFAQPKGFPGKAKTLLSVGRLAYQKNMDALVTAFAMIAPRFPDWNLLIVGDGEDRAKLEKMARYSGFADRISMPGACSDLAPYFTSSHLFCLSSRWEGFPNVLAEAMSHNLPAVGYAGCAGVYDLIENNITGLLAEGNGDPTTLANVLSQLMEQDERREQMGNTGRQAITAFTPTLVFDQWENFLKTIAF